MGGLSLAGAEPVLVLIAAPLLLFPHSYLPWVGLGFLIVGWALRGIGTGVWLVGTPLNRPIAVLFLMTMVSLYPSVDLSLSMPKFYGIILGLFIFYAAVSNINSERRFWQGIWLLVVSVVVISLLGGVGTDWSTNKLPVLQQVYAVMPRVIRSVQTSFGASTGFHSNEVGGTLAFLLPLPIALIFGANWTRLRKAELGIVALLGLGVLVLTASRSGFMGLAVAAVVLAVWRWRRIGLVALFVGLVALGVALRLNAPAIMDFLFKVDATTVAQGGGALVARSEIWERAQYMIQDFPFTGIGLNTFPVILDTLYPSFLAGADARIPHAHNIFLQTAVDLGLGGFVGFLGLWACAAFAGWKAYQRAAVDGVPRTAVQAATVGLLLGLLSYLVYGLTDAITLGAKPTGLLWLMLGLLVSAQRITFNAQPQLPASQPVSPHSYSFANRAVRLLTVTVWDSFWIITFALVGLGLLVVAVSIFGGM